MSAIAVAKLLRSLCDAYIASSMQANTAMALFVKDLGISLWNSGTGTTKSLGFETERSDTFHQI
jgi:hypothetical protein